MRILFCADTHFGVYPYGGVDTETQMNSRMLDLFKNFDRAVDYAIDNKADVFLLCGDVYKLKAPRNAERREFLKRVKRLIDQKIYLIIVVGNHDVSAHLHSLDFSEFGLDYIEVVDKPRIIDLETESMVISILALPWIRKSDVEAFKGSQGMLKSMVKQMEGDVRILAGHMHVKEAKMGATDFVLYDENAVSLQELVDLKLDAVLLGHIHKAQVLSENPFVAYAGSIGKIDFGERMEEKGFFVLEFE